MAASPGRLAGLFKMRAAVRQISSYAGDGWRHRMNSNTAEAAPGRPAKYLIQSHDPSQALPG